MVWNGAIIGEASRHHLVVCKQMEQEFISPEKQNDITNNYYYYTRLVASFSRQPG